MKNFLSQNWFKSVIAFSVIIISVSAFYYFVVLSHQKEERIQEQAQADLIIKNEKQAQIQAQDQTDLIEKNKLDIEKQQKEKFNNFVNKCITDAYTELKTLQYNHDVVGRAFCAQALKIGTSCSDSNDITEKAKKEAYDTYINEWVPQCKLGNRVFIHYEPMSN